MANVKLTPDQVVEINRDPDPAKAVARKYRVSLHTVYQIRNAKGRAASLGLKPANFPRSTSASASVKGRRGRPIVRNGTKRAPAAALIQINLPPGVKAALNKGKVVLTIPGRAG